MPDLTMRLRLDTSQAMQSLKALIGQAERAAAGRTPDESPDQVDRRRANAAARSAEQLRRRDELHQQRSRHSEERFRSMMRQREEQAIARSQQNTERVRSLAMLREEQVRARHTRAEERWRRAMHSEEERRKNTPAGAGWSIPGAAMFAAKATAAAGMVYAGFQDSTAWNRMTHEMGNLAREMAAIFEPIVGITSRAARAARTSLSQMSSRDQNRVLDAVAIGGAAYFARRPLTIGASLLAGAFMRSPVAAIMAIGAAGGIGAEVNARRRADQLSDAYGTPAKPEEVDFYGYDRLRHMAYGDQRREINTEARRLRAAQTRLDQYMRSRSNWGLVFSTINPFDERAGRAEVASVQKEIDRRLEVLSALRWGRSIGGAGDTNPGRRMLMDASTTGYGDIGSTAAMLQETMLRTGVGLSDQNQPRHEESLLEQAVRYLQIIAYGRRDGIREWTGED